jgi:zinc transporter, ZIP family
LRDTPLALLAAVTLDGVPENLALGVSLVGGASLSLLVAIFFSNLPESLVGAVAMRNFGTSPRIVVLAVVGATRAPLARAIARWSDSLEPVCDSP